MAYRNANVDNRLRYLVRGRVILFTTSTRIEFLEESLNYSYPLFAANSMPQGYGIAGCVEVNGYLTFDAGSQVKIVEVDSYKSTQVNQQSFWFTQVADPYEPTILYIQGLPGSSGFDRIRLTYNTKANQEGDNVDVVFKLATPLSDSEYYSYLETTAPKRGSVYLGKDGYKSLGYTYVAE